MMILGGLLIHIIFLLSIFDIYFKSPVISGVKEFYPIGTAPASRLVLFSADGLRMESLMRSQRAPYLKHIMMNRGMWGISNTRVPTESRPGHVAIIAGLYEDPSAVAKGWQENPVDFDSIFNRSTHTWSWGSPDILPMFAKGAVGNHVDTFFYSHAEEDFSGKVATTKLDTWVFEHVESFLTRAKTNSATLEVLKKDKIVFFLHLLGLDTAGHTHKPHSNEYEENIRVVNNGIKKMEQLFEDFFDHDNKTAYIFTADHGMTDWGSHGAGEDHETQTPLIAWGAGIALPEDPLLVSDITINSTYRKDVKQADICPLMATLIGIPIPVNSEGILPVTYFGDNTELKANGLYSNARQMLSQYNRKRQMIEENVILKIYRPFLLLTQCIVEDAIITMKSYMKIQNYDKVIELSNKTISLSLQGLGYYHNYYQQILLFSITFSFLGWIWWLLTTVVEHYMSGQQLETSPQMRRDQAQLINRFNNRVHMAFILMLAAIIYLLYVQNLPWQYFFYFCLPVILWWKGMTKWKVWADFIGTGRNNQTFRYLNFGLGFCLYHLGILALIFSFTNRVILGVALLGVFAFPLYSPRRGNVPKGLFVCWFISNLALIVFSCMPVVGKTYNTHLVGVSGLFWFISCIIFLFKYSYKMLKSGQESKKENFVIVVPALMMLVAIQTKYYVDFLFEKKQGLSTICQVLSWSLSVLSLVLPMFSSRWMISRLFSIFSSLAVFFLLLSIGHEALFLLFFTGNLLCWVSIEHYLSNPKENKLSLVSFNRKQSNFIQISPFDRLLNCDDFRRAYFFLVFIILAFFGTGNIASMNSFDPTWVRCFVSQFSPFLMSALILCKTLVPFLFVACAFCGVNLVVKAPTGQIFLIVLAFSDHMGLYFLHQVKNTGSWLEIGTSISHFVIMETIILFLSLLYMLGQFMTGTSGWTFKSSLKTLKMQ